MEEAHLGSLIRLEGETLVSQLRTDEFVSPNDFVCAWEQGALRGLQTSEPVRRGASPGRTGGEDDAGALPRIQEEAAAR